MTQIITAREAVEMIPDGSSIMFGGFMTCGGSGVIVDAMIESGLKDIHLICNDAGLPGQGVGRLIDHKRVKRLTATHVGLHPAVAVQINAGELEYTLAPQGTLAERIRAAGAGLGGILTPTGVGTPVAEGKKTLTIDGRDYLLELPLFADFAVLRAHLADKAGNLVYRRAARNFNPLMATAAKLVMVEAENIVEVGEIDPDQVMTPAVFIDYLVPA